MTSGLMETEEHDGKGTYEKAHGEPVKGNDQLALFLFTHIFRSHVMTKRQKEECLIQKKRERMYRFLGIFIEPVDQLHLSVM